MKTIPLKQTEKLIVTGNEPDIESKITNIERFLPESANMICRVTTKNKIKFFNQDFKNISGFNQDELLNKNYDNIKHPEMPEIINLVIKNSLENDKDILAIVKNKTKAGDFFWTASLFSPNRNPDNLQMAFSVKSTAIPFHVRGKINNLYNKLYKIEKHLDVITASKYLIGFLEEKNYSYSQYIQALLDESE